LYIIKENSNFVQYFVNRLSSFDTYRWLLLLLLFVSFSAPDIRAQSRQSLEEQRKRALLEIKETESLLNETQKSQKQSLDRLNLLNAQVKQFEGLIGGISAEIAFADRQISETSAKVTQMSNEIEKMKDEYAKLVFQAYKNRGQYNKLIYVLSAKDFNEAYRRMKYFQQYSEYRKKQVAEITVKQQELRVEIERLAAQKAEQQKLLAEQQQEIKKLEIVKTQQNKEVNSLKSKERQLNAQLEARRRTAQRLDNEIRKLIEAEAKKLNVSATNLYEALTPEERLTANNFRGNRGRLPWPTERGTITGHFGINPTIHKNVQLPNNGIDITTVAEADVRVIFDGEVTKIIAIIGGNLNVLVRHGSYFTVYSNLVDVRVKQGDKVKHKDVIGKVYTEKGSKTAVLHFEIWEGMNKLNPVQWIGKN